MTASRPLIEPTAPDERLSAEDLASRRADEFLADALAVQVRQAGHTMIKLGVCSNCGERCHAAAVYCDPECRTDHEGRLRILARQGVLGRG